MSTEEGSHNHGARPPAQVCAPPGVPGARPEPRPVARRSGGCMRATLWTTLTSLALACCLAWGQQAAVAEPHRAALRLPWREAGLTERQAAAHLLNRFAFGPRPGE